MRRMFYVIYLSTLIMIFTQKNLQDCEFLCDDSKANIVENGENDVITL